MCCILFTDEPSWTQTNHIKYKQMPTVRHNADKHSCFLDVPSTTTRPNQLVFIQEWATMKTSTRCLVGRTYPSADSPCSTIRTD